MSQEDENTDAGREFQFLKLCLFQQGDLHSNTATTTGTTNQRALLRENWASLKKFYKYQPLDHIKDYFGVKIGLYFAWLGFYTYMLIPASIVGIFCFIYAVSTISEHAPRFVSVCLGDVYVSVCVPRCFVVCVCLFLHYCTLQNHLDSYSTPFKTLQKLLRVCISKQLNFKDSSKAPEIIYITAEIA